MILGLPIKGVIRSVVMAAAIAIPPAFLPPLLLSPHASAGVRVALYAGILAVLLPLMMIAGLFRWNSLGVWRPGWRPCLCDQPAHCYRHHSSLHEHHRPGVVAVRLAACCTLHTPGNCCDPEDCGPCCKNCPDCPQHHREDA